VIKTAENTVTETVMGTMNGVKWMMDPGSDVKILVVRRYRDTSDIKNDCAA
jgi:hypothetical protein